MSADASTRPMRILLLSQFYPPVLGGIEIHVAALARGLAMRGHHVAVATLAGQTGDDAPGVAVDDAGVEIHRLQGTAMRFGALYATERRHAPPVPDPELVLGLRRLIRRFSPDIVHAHNWIGRSYLPISRTSGARYVVTLHDCSRACAQGRMMYRGESYCHPTDALRCLDCCTYQYGAIKGFVTLLGNRVVRRSEMRAVDLYLPVSKAVAEANQLADGRARYEIVPNFVDDAPVEHGELPREIELLPTEPFILQVGDVVDDKGVRVLLEAYTGLESPPPLVLIGRIAPEMRAELPPGVVATGPLPHALVAEAWRRSFFGTMPSLCLDACPTVTLEAMAASKPVVASARGGLTDQVVGGQTGFLVPPGDALALRDAMARLIADSALRRRMGDAARKRFEGEFRADVIIDRIQRLYCEVAEG